VLLPLSPILLLEPLSLSSFAGDHAAHYAQEVELIFAKWASNIWPSKPTQTTQKTLTSI